MTTSDQDRRIDELCAEGQGVLVSPRRDGMVHVTREDGREFRVTPDGLVWDIGLNHGGAAELRAT